MRLAIYHLEAKVISRGTGRSAVAAAAYMSCSRMYNDYDGVQHDYTRKQGLVWQQVFLPDMAPAEWADREILWNAVEEAEKTKDSSLAREFVVALPVELNAEQWKTLLTDFIQEQFVSEGMCADVCIHDTDGHNPHAHIMLTVRPLTKDGKWQHKTEKEYLCVRDGEERGFTSAEFKAAQTDGWEKQYQYKIGKKKVYMTPSAAKAQGFERASKYPKSTKYGRQNPITARWNSEEQLVLWRAAWADTSNRYLEKAGREERIDHRSYAERGLDEQPTIHEGVTAHALERKGIVSDRCELNRQIKADNALLRELKSLVNKLMDTVKNTIPAIAAAMETIRQNIIVFNYGLLFVRDRRKSAKEYVKQAARKYGNYKDIRSQIKAKAKERSKLQKELAGLPLFATSKHKELKAKIAELSEEIEDLQFEEKSIMRAFDKEDAAGMKDVEGEISKSEARIAELDAREIEFTGAINREMGKFSELKKQAVNLDQDELTAARLVLRPQIENEGRERIRKGVPDGRISFAKYQAGVRDVDRVLDEDGLTKHILGVTEKEKIAITSRGKDNDFSSCRRISTVIFCVEIICVWREIVQQGKIQFLRTVSEIILIKDYKESAKRISLSPALLLPGGCRAYGFPTMFCHWIQSPAKPSTTTALRA